LGDLCSRGVQESKHSMVRVNREHGVRCIWTLGTGIGAGYGYKFVMCLIRFLTCLVVH